MTVFLTFILLAALLIIVGTFVLNHKHVLNTLLSLEGVIIVLFGVFCWLAGCYLHNLGYLTIFLVLVACEGAYALGLLVLTVRWWGCDRYNVINSVRPGSYSKGFKSFHVNYYSFRLYKNFTKILLIIIYSIIIVNYFILCQGYVVYARDPMSEISLLQEDLILYNELIAAASALPDELFNLNPDLDSGIVSINSSIGPSPTPPFESSVSACVASAGTRVEPEVIDLVEPEIIDLTRPEVIDLESVTNEDNLRLDFSNISLELQDTSSDSIRDTSLPSEALDLSIKPTDLTIETAASHVPPVCLDGTDVNPNVLAQGNEEVSCGPFCKVVDGQHIHEFHSPVRGEHSDIVISSPPGGNYPDLFHSDLSPVSISQLNPSIDFRPLTEPVPRPIRCLLNPAAQVARVLFPEDSNDGTNL